MKVCPICQHPKAEHRRHDEGCLHRDKTGDMKDVPCGCAGPEEWWS